MIKVRTILLATTNAAKAERLAWLVAGLPLTCLVPVDLGLRSPDVHERGTSFVENAAAKAIAWSDLAPGILVLASDGGLRIPALGQKWSELLTKRNAGEGVGAPQRISHLLALMDGLSGEQRSTVWCEALALACGGTLLRTWMSSGNGGAIVERYVAGEADDEFWTESIRIQPLAGKLYRDLSDEELARYDTVWPALRIKVREYFLRQ